MSALAIIVDILAKTIIAFWILFILAMIFLGNRTCEHGVQKNRCPFCWEKDL